MSTITSTIKKLRLFTQNHIRGTVIGDGFINVLKAMGVNDCFTKIIYAQDRKNPTKSMLYAQKYFAEHQKKTAEIASLFADDFSREVYFSVIKYRMSHNPKDVPLFSKHDQYFVKDIVPLTDKEVFIDCGAFDGDTMKDFIKATGGNYQSIVCFEPVEEFHKKLVKRGAGKNITAICAGVYKESTTLQFNAEAGKGSSISADAVNTVSVPVRAIDDVPECKDATFIKMDVEGSELDALKGARQTILRNKPKLAICLYHKTKDYIEIPNWIHTLVPEYKLYVRHHSFSINETVLYAIPPET
ncbi:MAG: FkbM family methyltransferase [Lachnospiraceae bacterium]|nr:FkbM family methyltransferase [Lachnospiraceae bacterium]